MARIRSIRPEFWSDAKVGKLSLAARLLFIALWNFADDEGYGRALPKELAGFAFPHDDDMDSVRIRVVLGELSGKALVTLYEVSGEPYYFINNWSRHQRPEKPTKSKHPKPDQGTITSVITGSGEESTTTPRSLPESSGSSPPLVNRNLEVGSRNQDIDRGGGSSDEARTKRIVEALSNYAFTLAGPQVAQVVGEIDLPPTLLKDNPDLWCDWICLAIKEAADHGARNLSYLMRVIQNSREKQTSPVERPAEKGGKPHGAYAKPQKGADHQPYRPPNGYERDLSGLTPETW